MYYSTFDCETSKLVGNKKNRRGYVQFDQDLKSAIQKSTKKFKQRSDLSELEGLLAERNLKIVKIQGDRNCFFLELWHTNYMETLRNTRIPEQERYNQSINIFYHYFKILL